MFQFQITCYTMNLEDLKWNVKKSSIDANAEMIRILEFPDQINSWQQKLDNWQC